MPTQVETKFDDLMQNTICSHQRRRVSTAKGYFKYMRGIYVECTFEAYFRGMERQFMNFLDQIDLGEIHLQPDLLRGADLD